MGDEVTGGCDLIGREHHADKANEQFVHSVKLVRCGTNGQPFVAGHGADLAVRLWRCGKMVPHNFLNLPEPLFPLLEGTGYDDAKRLTINGLYSA